MEAGVRLEAGARVLIASKAPELVAELVEQLSRNGGGFQFVGASDPDLGASLALWTKSGDILLIDAESLLRLWNRSGVASPDWLARFRTLVLVEPARLVELVSRTQRLFRLILFPARERLGSVMGLALEGYVTLPPEVVEDLCIQKQRLRTVAEMAEEERRVLACLGAAYSAKRIEQATGFSESRVKLLTQTIIRKLHMTNRTAVAVFVATNGLAAAMPAPDALHEPAASG